MNILYLCGGMPDSRVSKELNSLSRKHTVTLFCWDRDKRFSGIRKMQVGVLGKVFDAYCVGIVSPIGSGYKKRLIPLVRFTLKEFMFLLKRMRKYDALHICCLDTAVPIFLLPKRPKTVYDIFDYFADSHSAPKFITWMLRKIEQSIIMKSDSVVICSEERRKQIAPATPKHLTVIHNAPPMQLIKNTSTENEIKKNNTYSIAYAGLLTEDRFLREMADVISNRDDCELHIGGIGVLEPFFEELSQRRDNITYYGKMPYEDVLSLEKQCDIMTAIYDPRIPNHKYAAPNKFYEALMLKKPLIMMCNTGMDSYVEKYQLGEVIDSGAKSFQEVFSRALDNLIAKKEQWEEMGERGYKLYREQFSWDEMEKRLLNLYDDLESNINKD